MTDIISTWHATVDMISDVLVLVGPQIVHKHSIDGWYMMKFIPKTKQLLGKSNNGSCIIMFNKFAQHELMKL